MVMLSLNGFTWGKASAGAMTDAMVADRSSREVADEPGAVLLDAGKVEGSGRDKLLSISTSRVVEIGSEEDVANLLVNSW